MVSTRHNNQRALESQRRREAFIAWVAKTGCTSREACEHFGWGWSTYTGWRNRHEDFGPRVDEARRIARHGRKAYEEGNFISFRRCYLSMETTWFQQQIADAIEAARPGEVTLVLIPPEHGKTTLLEDWCTFKLVTDPSFRITVGSETVDHGEKVVTRVRERLEPGGPTPAIAKDFGPFAPESTKSSQVWGQRRFNVAGKRISDERDFSMNCVGITGRVQGTRCDLLLLDDVQDIKSIELSEKYFEIIKQSFLSRPSMFGRTVIIGTRVGEYDVYRRMIDAQLADKVIRIPAYRVSEGPPWPAPEVKPHIDKPETWAPEGIKFLWPEKYDQEEAGGIVIPGLHRYRYAALRFRVGEQTWWRIYMQRPEAATSMTFDGATTEAMRDPHRSVIADPRPVTNIETERVPVGDRHPVPVIVAVDPAVGGGNGVLAAAARPTMLEVLNCRLDYGLTKYSQIIEMVEDYCFRYSTQESVVSLVVVEDKAFQKGLLQDDRMMEVQRRFGFRLVPNTTGREKVDPDIGVPAMPMAMVRREITIPWADEISRTAMAPLLDQLHMWRPGVNGVKLPQDLVMCLWFAYRQWRGVRDTPVHPIGDSNDFRAARSPLRHARPRSIRRRTPYRSLRGGPQAWR